MEKETHREPKEEKAEYQEGDHVRVKATGQQGRVKITSQLGPGIVEVQLQGSPDITQFTAKDIERAEDETKTYNDGDKVRIKATGKHGTVRSKKQVAREPVMVEVQLDGSTDTVQYADKDIERVEEKKEK